MRISKCSLSSSLLILLTRTAPARSFTASPLLIRSKRARMPATIVPDIRQSRRLRAAKSSSSSPNKRLSSVTPIKPNEISSTPRLVKRRRATVTPSPVQSKINAQPDSATSSSTSDTSNTSISYYCTDTPDNVFDDLQVTPEELRPSTTLTTGQCFHWKELVAKQQVAKQKSAWGSHNATEWIGCLRVSPIHSMVVVIRETPTTTLYRVLSPLPASLNVQQFLRHYFQLETPLQPLVQRWGQQDSRLKRIAACIPGVRILNQDPWECLASFICSSNNNIPRITKILQSIRETYGQPLLTVEMDQGGPMVIYSFPSLTDLMQQATEMDLREKCGIGYRAKYIMETMELLTKFGGEQYLLDLKSNTTLTAVEVQEQLIQFSGVGRKVADCVALFSLQQAEAIPVDVHVWNIACRDYDPTLQMTKSLTPTIYRQVGDLFRSQFDTKAGWAHSLLFVAELPSFRPVLPLDMVEEMEKVRPRIDGCLRYISNPIVANAKFPFFCFAVSRGRAGEKEGCKDEVGFGIQLFVQWHKGK